MIRSANEFLARAEELLESVPTVHLLTVAHAIIQLDGQFKEERLRDVDGRRKAIGEIALMVNPEVLSTGNKEELISRLMGKVSA